MGFLFTEFAYEEGECILLIFMTDVIFPKLSVV